MSAALPASSRKTAVSAMASICRSISASSSSMTNGAAGAASVTTSESERSPTSASARRTGRCALRQPADDDLRAA